MKWPPLAAGLIVALALAGCAAGTPAPTTRYSVELTSDPTPPRSGQASTLRARVTDEAGAPVAGAKVAMQREHLEAAHDRPTSDATEGEPGLYTARANFSMSGKWKVTVTADGPQGRAQRDFEIQVQ